MLLPPEETVRSVSSTPKSRFGRSVAVIAILMPLISAIVFVQRFAIAMPLTDDWILVRGVMWMQSAHGWDAMYQAAAIRIYGHCIAVPFLIYWAISGLVHFDSRPFIYISVACYAVQVLIFHRNVTKSVLWSFPIALVVFSPAHFMDFQWGFQFTQSLSIVFPMLGLMVVDRINTDDSLVHQLRDAVIALVLMGLGVASSAGAAFGLIAAFVLVAVKPFPLRPKGILMALFLAATYIVIEMITGGQIPYQQHLTIKNVVIHFLTAIGGTVVGSPEVLSDFSVTFTCLFGLAIVVFTLAIFIRAISIGALHRLAFPLGLITFGVLMTLIIALNRPCLGNWHLQFAFPAIFGAYAAGLTLIRIDKSAFAVIPFAALVASLSLSLFSYYQGFTKNGPEYNAYARSIQDYANRVTNEPELKKPFPPTGGWDIDAEMVQFLKEQHHEAFRGEQVAAPAK